VNTRTEHAAKIFWLQHQSLPHRPPLHTSNPHPLPATLHSFNSSHHRVQTMGLIPTFGLGGLFQSTSPRSPPYSARNPPLHPLHPGTNSPKIVSILLINAIAILSEDRFLARIGWSASSATEPAFGAGAGAAGDASVKAKIINLMTSIRTLMRSMLSYFLTILLLFVVLGGGCGDGEKGEMLRKKGRGRKLGKLIMADVFCVAVPLIGINTMVILYELMLG
jgi:immediate early response 3-interacting protein 1